MQIQIPPCKHYFQSPLGMILSLHFNSRPIDLYDEAGSPRGLWITYEVPSQGKGCVAV